MASSSDWSFFGGVTTKAEAASTSATNRETESATEAQKMKKESTWEVEKTSFSFSGFLLLLRRERIGNGFLWRKDLERRNLRFFLEDWGNGGRREEVSKEAEEAEAIFWEGGDIGTGVWLCSQSIRCLLSGPWGFLYPFHLKWN